MQRFGKRKCVSVNGAMKKEEMEVMFL